MVYTDKERRLLSHFFSEVDGSEHADIYLVRNLPAEVAATLNGVYSRSSKSMRDQFLDRLRHGLQSQGRSLDDLEFEDEPKDLLSTVMADKAGQFLKTYAIDHGHNSLREGSVVHLAVERVSQLVTRFIQRERRCSFEESSTRYISFGAETHWRDPDVMAAGGDVAGAYREVIDSTFSLYLELQESLLQWLKEARPLGPGEKEAAWLRTLKAEAFDSVRYLLTPAIFTKWGMVADARTMSDVITELLSHPLAEFQLVGERMKRQAERVLPTLLSHARPSGFLQALHECLPELATGIGPAVAHHDGPAEGRVDLLAWDQELDDKLLASLVYERARAPYGEVLAQVRGLSAPQRQSMLDEVLARRGDHDALPAGLEGAQPFDFEVLLDFGAYRDVGRHRKGFQQQQTLTVDHGFAVPPLLREAGLTESYCATLERAATAQRLVAEHFPLAAGYVTPFAFLQRVRIQFDPRQVAYFIELRSGPEGHFSYRRVALDMLDHVEGVAPLFARFIRAQKGESFLGRLESETTADERRLRRMKAAGDV